MYSELLKKFVRNVDSLTAASVDRSDLHLDTEKDVDFKSRLLQSWSPVDHSYMVIFMSRANICMLDKKCKINVSTSVIYL